MECKMNVDGKHVGVRYAFWYAFVYFVSDLRRFKWGRNVLERNGCGLFFFKFIYLFVHRRNFVAMRIRKIQFAPVMRPLSRHPCTIVRKDFMFSPGQLELEAVLDKQVSIITLPNYTPSNNNIHGMARYDM